MTTQGSAQVTLLLPNGAELIVNDLPFYIGRRAQSDLVIQDPRVSNTHCALEFDAQGVDSQLFIRDLRSRNGTMLRRGEVDLIVHGAPVPVQEGDLIMLGDRGGEVVLTVSELNLSASVSERSPSPEDSEIEAKVETTTADISSRPLDPPTLLATPLPPSEDEPELPDQAVVATQERSHLYEVALSLSAALEPHEVAREALGSISPLLQRAHVAQFYPMMGDRTAHEAELTKPIGVEGVAHTLAVDPTQVRLAVALNKHTPLHILPGSDPELLEGLIIPVSYQGKALGALVVACVHPPLSSATRSSLYDLSALLGARLHSARYYQALKASAEELVRTYEALHQAHLALLKRAGDVEDTGDQDA